MDPRVTTVPDGVFPEENAENLAAAWGSPLLFDSPVSRL